MAKAATLPLDRANRRYAVGLGRAFAGAIIFSLPLLMTMEMWWLGFYLDRPRFLQFAILHFVVLIGLSRVAGFEETSSRLEDLLDAFAAFLVGTIASAAILWIFGVIGTGTPASEAVGKIAIQALPASVGAMLAAKQLGVAEEVEQEQGARWRETYAGELFLMLAGALFLAYNVAPTEEMILIAFQMSAWQGLALVLVSLLLLHAFVYSVGFSGQEDPGERGFFAAFLHFSLAGYAIALAVSLYVLWTFGRTDGAELAQIAMMTTVLGFPAAIGAAIARLVI